VTSNNISQRKVDHLKIALSDQVQIGSAGFKNYSFTHNALPELNFEDIDTSTEFLGKKVNYPFFISCMTGGVEKGSIINKNLAIAAQKHKIPMGVGSQRSAIENPEYAKSYAVVRKYAVDIPVMANVGLVQLNYGFGLKEIEAIIKMVDADALVFHINPVQEVIQPEGDRNFGKLIGKLEKIIDKIKVPVIAKEVGFGLSFEVVEKLYQAGVRIFDTAGWGGTNWAMVEGLREKADLKLAQLFSNWGIPTTESIIQCKKFSDSLQKRTLKLGKSNSNSKSKRREDVVILGSGGVRSGVDVAKALALGADLAGIAAPFAKKALVSAHEVEKLILSYATELRVAMFATGSKNIKKLKNTRLLKLK